MSINDDDIKLYYDAINQGLKGDPSRKKVLRDVKCSVEAHIDNNPDITIEEIMLSIGTPREIIDENLRIAPSEVVYKSILSPKRIRVIIISCVTALVVCTIIYLVLVFLDGQIFSERTPQIVYKNISEFTSVPAQISLF